MTLSGDTADDIKEDVDDNEAKKLGLGRNFHTYLAARSISQIGSQVSLVTIPILAVTNLGASPVAMGVLATAGILGPLVFGAPASWLADRIGRHLLVMTLLDLIQGVVAAVVPLLWFAHRLTIPILIADVLVASALMTAYASFSQPLVPMVVDRSQLLRANSIAGVLRSVSAVIGPGIAGALIGAFSSPTAILVDAVSFIGSALVTSRIRLAVADRGVDVVPQPTDTDSRMRRILARLFALPDVQILILVCFVTAIVNAEFTIYLIETLRIKPAVIGPLLMIGALGGIIAGILLTRTADRIRPLGARLGGIGLTVLSLIFLPFAQPGWSAIAATIVFEFTGSFGGTILIASIMSDMQANTHRKVAGRVLGLTNTLMQAFSAVGALAAGLVVAASDLRFTIGLASGLFVVVAAILMIREWGTRRSSEPVVLDAST